VVTGSCHCGAVRVDVPRRPHALTDCNCSICRRYGALWAYYTADSVRIECAADALDAYSWGTKELRFLRCATCGCLIAWVASEPRAGGRIGVNARNLDPAAIRKARVRCFDGADTWKFLDSDAAHAR